MYDNDMRLDRSLDPDWQSVQIGTPVMTSDGKLLGTVHEKPPDGLLVRGEKGAGTDYMVTARDVARIEADGVHLIVNENQAMRAHWEGTSPSDAQAPGGMAPGSMQRENPTPS